MRWFAPFAQRWIPVAALKALAAGNGPIEKNTVSRGESGDAGSDGFHDTRAFMAHDQGTFPPERCLIGVADASGLDLYQDFERLRERHLDFFDGESARPVCDGCQRFHGCTGIKVEIGGMKSVIREKSLS